MTDTTVEAMEVDGDGNDEPSVPVGANSNATSTQKYYSLLESVVQKENARSVEDAVASLKSYFKEADEVVEKQNFCVAVGLFSMLNKSSFSDDAESSILPLLQTLVTDGKIDTQLARCLVEHIPDGSILDRIFKKDQIGDLQRKLRLTNTSTFYRQHKFNLLAEESEGYSKLLLLYSNPTTTSNGMLEHMIGTFSLDPVRCLDLAIDCLSLYLKKKTTTNPSTDNDDAELSMLIRSITTTIATLSNSTQKLPQLLAFKLKQQDVLLQLPTLQYLCRKKILMLQELVPYMHSDSSYQWEKVVAMTAATFVIHEEKRVRSMGKTRLTATKTAETDTTRNDLIASVSGISIVRIMLTLLQSEEEEQGDDSMVLWDDIVSPLSKDWSDMAILFPDSIGTAILDALSRRLQPFLMTDQSPWATTTASSTRPKLSELLESIGDPLDSVLDSGCMRLRPGLYISICRLLVQVWPNDCEMTAGAALKKDLMNFLGNFLLPTLSVFPPNPAINLELWLVLQKLAYPDRYCLYKMWAASSASMLWLAHAEATVMKDARYALRRLSKDTVRELSRNIGKCCSRCPIAVFSTILNQIESYDNLVHVMIDACAFVGPLGWDVLSYCILQRLSAARRDRYKESGVHASQWLQSLESFAGAFYKRYPTAECQGLVSYLRSRLEDGHVLELGMLGALVKSAGGWAFRDHATAAAAGLTSSQLDGRAGSIMLQRQTMSFGVVEGIDWRAAREIQKVLREDGVALLVLLTQVEYQLVFVESKKPVKLIGNSVDECRAIRTILLDFLTNEQVEETAVDHYMKSLPTMNKLLDDFLMEATSIWSLHRPILRKHPASVTQEARESLRSMTPSNSWTQMTFQLYETFFSNALYDIHYPKAIYETEISMLERKVESLSQKTRGPDEQLTYMKRIVDNLKNDKAKQSDHVNGIHEQVKSKAKEYFVNVDSSVKAMMVFAARCIYPRCMQGPDDAFYCVKFIELLHQSKTPGFGLLHLYDCLIPVLSRSLYCLTEGEAACASILLGELWKTVNTCRYDKDVFASYFPSESFDDYKLLFNNWHSSLGATCLGCLKSTEYMHLRNGLIVLARIVDVFPTKPKLGDCLLASLGPLQEEGNAMADIRAAARAYHMQLTKARGEGAWKEEDRAVVKDRENKIKAAAAERQKRAEEAMAEIKRDSEKITEEIGERDTRDRGRGHHHDRRAPEATDRRPPPSWQPRSTGGASSQHHPLQPQDQRGQHVGGEDAMRRRDDRESRPPRTETRKRSHPSSPIEQGEALDDAGKTPYKRSRGAAPDTSNKEHQQEEGDADAGGRRRQRRRNNIRR